MAASNVATVDETGSQSEMRCGGFVTGGETQMGQSASKGMKAGAAMSRISMKIKPPIALDVTLINAKGFC